MDKPYHIVLDQSTSGTKLLLFENGKIRYRKDKKHQQIYPKVGWVEHDPLDIWHNVQALLADVFSEQAITPAEVAALSITNQRETIIAWDRTTGKPLYNAIVWQCNRSAAICESMLAKGLEPMINQKTGLKIDPYFSGTKIKWLVNEITAIKEKSGSGDLAIGTMDSWLLWHLTEGKVFATEASNACRTLLYNISTLDWDMELIDLFGIDLADLPMLNPADASFGYYRGIPIKGVMADSQAALFGEECTDIGDVKITMGTGCSIMMQVQQQNQLRDQRILTTTAWQTAHDQAFALEGIIRSCGDAINWFSEHIAPLQDVTAICDQILDQDSDEAIYFIPALQGMGAPFWNNQMTASFLGMKRTSTQNDLLRAVLESTIFQIKAVIDVMEEVSGRMINQVMIDGGMSKNTGLMTLLATLLHKEVVVSEVEEFSAIGTMSMAKPQQQAHHWQQKRIQPKADQATIRLKYEKWKRLIDLSIALEGE
ncbi:glycerol kinase [Enterococcus sp. 8G7_MSG3316]|uniref:ATP:glycerol 3-phosphotransferase n=1 Tax=Candidatus Enterococcus testudinis TaxID=1834191 RepID=A0A242A1Y2_9ENTE|nr:FGGY family carbohydrate kinase [Enterococcus sp. 8G7_MSG3316]OTN75048.1 glycerol kinase [Enterococcus sp. 8G7_MSG3316]